MKLKVCHLAPLEKRSSLSVRRISRSRPRPHWQNYRAHLAGYFLRGTVHPLPEALRNLVQLWRGQVLRVAMCHDR